MQTCVLVCVCLLEGGGSAPSCLGSAISLCLRTSLFSETAKCIQAPVYMFVHLGGKQTAQQISTLQVLCERRWPGWGMGGQHMHNTVFFLPSINFEEESEVGRLVWLVCCFFVSCFGWLVWGFLIKPSWKQAMLTASVFLPPFWALLEASLCRFPAAFVLRARLCVSPCTCMAKAQELFPTRWRAGRRQDSLMLGFQSSLTFFLLAGKHPSLFLLLRNSRRPNLYPFLRRGAVAFKFGCGHGERQVHEYGISLQALNQSSSSLVDFLLKHITSFAAGERETISGVNLVLKALYYGKRSRVQLRADTPGQTIGAVSASREIENLFVLDYNLQNYTHIHTHTYIYSHQRIILQEIKYLQLSHTILYLANSHNPLFRSPVPAGAQKLSIITWSLYTGKHFCTKSFAGVNWQRATGARAVVMIYTSCGSSPEKCEKLSELCASKGYTASPVFLVVKAETSWSPKEPIRIFSFSSAVTLSCTTEIFPSFLRVEKQCFNFLLWHLYQMTINFPFPLIKSNSLCDSSWHWYVSGHACNSAALCVGCTLSFFREKRSPSWCVHGKQRHGRAV